MTSNGNQSNNSHQGRKQEEAPKSKFHDTLDNLTKSDKMEHLYDYARGHTQDTLAYVILVVGILWSLFQGLYGGLIVGLVAGYYFSKELTPFFKSYQKYIEELGTARSLIFGGTLLALFIAAPGIFIGVALMIGLKILLRLDN